MRHAVAQAENVENNSFAVTRLLKICTHCERLSKKVRERKKQTFINNAKRQSEDGICKNPCVTLLMFLGDVFFFPVWSKQAAVQSLCTACLRRRRVCDH